MNSNSRARRLLVGLSAIFVVGCASGATVSPSPALVTPAPTASATATTSAATTATATPAPAVASPTLIATPVATPTASISAGRLVIARQIQTATRLPDGRVLVAGGYTAADIALASAELFDPTTDAFIQTGSLAAARGYDTATLLADGRVLIAGGNPYQWTFDGPFIASAELYDPTKGTFSPTGSLATARNLHTATLLLDGRVLIAGGNDTRTHPLASAELYDPKTGTFKPTGSMTTARSFHTATLMSDGRVLIAGGASSGWDGNFLASAEIYDPKTGTFTATDHMADPRGSYTATLLSDGRVLITGGTNNGERSLASAELYDPKTETFGPTGPMSVARTFHAATVLDDGRVLLTGGDPSGWLYGGPFLAVGEIYDPKTGKFLTTGTMTTARTYHTATLLSDGRVLVTAGYGDAGPLASAELFDPTSGTFSPTGSGG
jgi:Galactose oxidase, central domain/Kelch motif